MSSACLFVPVLTQIFFSRNKYDKSNRQVCVYAYVSLYIHAVYGLIGTILAAGQLSVVLIRHFIDFDCISVLEA